MGGMQGAPLVGQISQDVAAIQDLMGAPGDLVVRSFALATGTQAALVFLKGLVDQGLVNQAVLRPLMDPRVREALPAGGDALEAIARRALPVASVRTVGSVGEAAQALMGGQTVLLVEGSPGAVAMETTEWPVRSPDDPKTEVLIRGPREGFVEHLPDNVAMVRRRLRDPRLRLEEMVLGAVTRTRVALLYLEGVADGDVVRRVRQRLRHIRTDAVLESGYIEQYVEDTPLALFPQVLHTERPDRVVAAVLEGRLAILVDGTPFALVLPATATMYLQSPEDYYERPVIVVLARMVRLAAVVVSAILPAVYVAFTAYHPEMLPTELVITILAGQYRLPFPPGVEALLLELFLELLLEGSVRLPAAVGPTVGIVGALIIGEMAVRAGIAGPIMIIVIATTALASYAVPGYVLAFSVKVVRIALLVLASFFGLIGLMVGINLLFVHMAALESFGVPYLSPLVPLNVKDMKDYIMRLPLWRMKSRPDELHPDRPRRQPRPASYLEGPDRGGGDGP